MRSPVLKAVACLVAIGVCSPAWGHGPQIQLTAEAGKIVTRQVLVDEYVPLSPATSIYVLPVAKVSNRWLVQPPGTTSSGPGIAPGVGFVDTASHPFKSGAYAMSVVDGLKRWDGANFVDAGATQLELYKTVDGVPTTASTTDAVPFASIAFTLDVTSDEAHTGMGYRFLGDGVSNTSPLQDGVYLLSLKVSAVGLADSEPFYFVLPKGVSSTAAGSVALAFALQRGIAADAIQAMTVVPEPTCWALATLGVGGCATIRRRQRFNQEAR